MLINVFMPHRRGFDSIRIFRERGPNTPIVAMSGYAFANAERAPDFLRMTTMIGATSRIGKPFTRLQFLTVVADCLHSSVSSAASA